MLRACVLMIVSGLCHQVTAYNVKPQGLRTPIPAPTDGTNCVDYPCLIFEDNFNTLDFNNWQHEVTAGGGGNWEFQYYHNNRTNSYINNGILYIKPSGTEEKYGAGFVSTGNLELWGSSPANLCTGNQWYGCARQGTATNYINPIQSARLRTAVSFNTRYGEVEIRAQMPKGDWLWPAIWMLPAHEYYGGWPASGEIDLVESRGNLDLKDELGNPQGYTRGGSTMHWGPYLPYNGFDKTGVSYDISEGYHTYGLEWNNQNMTFLLDGAVTMTVDPGIGFWDYGAFGLPANNNPWTSGAKMAPFDQSFYIVMNVAVGGTNGYFPDTWVNTPNPKPWTNVSPTGPKDFWDARADWENTWVGDDTAMKVDYVRVWKQVDSNQ